MVRAKVCHRESGVGPEVPTEVRSGYSWCSPPRKMHKRCRKRSSQLKWQKESSVQGEEAVCKDASSSVQEGLKMKG